MHTLATSLSPEHALNQAVLTAYGWHQDSPGGPAIDLAHDFQQVETLPENDRTRYTITPEARKELLKRLLTLNHRRADEEGGGGATTKSSPKPPKGPKPQRLQNPDELL